MHFEFKYFANKKNKSLENQSFISFERSDSKEHREVKVCLIVVFDAYKIMDSINKFYDKLFLLIY